MSGILKKVAVGLTAAAVAVSLGACSKGGGAAPAASGSGGTAEIAMWTHNAGNQDELAAIQQIVDDFNGSQGQYK